MVRCVAVREKGSSDAEEVLGAKTMRERSRQRRWQSDRERKYLGDD